MTPTTLRELRSAVARVLVARGEAEDALRVCCEPRRHGGAGVVCSVWPAHGVHPLESLAAADDGDEAAAIAAAWAAFAARVRSEGERAASALARAQRVHDRAQAAVEAARAVEAQWPEDNGGGDR